MVLEEKIILLLVVAGLVAIVARRFRLPYTVALTVTGLALGLLDLEAGLHLSKDLVFAIFLPALLYEAAFHLDVDHFRRDAGPILVLAVVGVILSILITGGLVYLGFSFQSFEPGFDLKYALLFGALISATDPISVMAIFKKLGVDKRLNLVVEGESLFNDGTAVVMFSLLLAAVAGHDAHGSSVEHLSALWVAGQFVKEVLGGAAVGLVLGLAFSYLTSRVEDHLIEILLTTVLAYGAWLVAEHLHVSGVIAVVSAGMMSGNYGSRMGMSPTTRMSVISFWEYAAFVVNSLIFLLIGMEVKIGQLWSYKYHILLAWAAVLAARSIVVYGLTPAIGRFFHPLPAKWKPVLIWGGLRGALSMALALSLDRDLPFREMILSMTFGVVVLSILGQAMSMKKLLDLLGMSGESGPPEYEQQRALLKSSYAALRELEEMHRERAVSTGVYEKLKTEYESRAESCEQSIRELHDRESLLEEDEYHATRRHLLALEKDSLRESFHLGMISEDVLKDLLAGVDAKLDEKRKEERGPEAE